MGLNESYEKARRHILLMMPLPSLNKTYSMLIERGSQRNISQSSASSSELNALFTSRNPTQSVPRSRLSHTSTYDPNAFCDYCKRTSHTQGICYQLHGYPPGYERKKKGQFSTNTGRGRPPNERGQYPAANNVVSESEHNHRSDLDHNSGMSSGNHSGSQGYVSSGNHGGSQGYGRGNSQVDQTDYQRGMTVLHEQYNQILTMLGQTNVHRGTEGPSTSHSSYSNANLAQKYPTTGPLKWAGECDW
ncbi:hypothetical protein AABB24_010427 [Solanum stoloniferum]|uniref:Uncharacterized protein n=1 Tax=Solanum stoloniferum TaxID=62892 RepID=A0ABD2UCI8_9SOLN